jgi:hypothetical protein
MEHACIRSNVFVLIGISVQNIVPKITPVTHIQHNKYTRTRISMTVHIDRGGHQFTTTLQNHRKYACIIANYLLHHLNGHFVWKLSVH